LYAVTASCVIRHPYSAVSIVVPEAIIFHVMTFARKLIQDIKAGQLGAGYLALELVALVVTVVLAISWFWR
jgi:hypothetical protein